MAKYPVAPALYPPSDHTAGVLALHRLYKYGHKHGKPALAVFAVYKALQILDEKNTALRNDDDREIEPGPIDIPAWVHGGLWFSMRTFLVKQNQPKVARFVPALRQEWREQRRWLAIYTYLEEHPGPVEPAAKHVAKTTALGSRSSLLKAYAYVDKLICDVNSEPFDGDDPPLPKIVSRDLAPTRYLHSIFASFE